MPELDQDNHINEGQDSNTLDDKFKSLLEEQTEKFKNEIAGLNRRNSELEKILKEKDEAIEAKEKEKLTDLEKLQMEMQREKEERAKFQRELKLEKNTSKALSFLDDAKIPRDFIKYLRVDEDETIQSQVEDLAILFARQKEGYAQEFAKSTGGKNINLPPGGSSKSWKDMTMAERSKLWTENPTLARQMMDAETPKR